MKTIKLRPAECCTPPTAVAPLQEGEKAELVGIFHALGDPTRLEIFRLIASQSAPICVCDITSRFDVTQPTISHHLKVLREAGLVSVSRQGIWAYYAARDDGLVALGDVLGALQLSEKEGVS
jgi:ArsR family transcriptional regulator, arsenate/arsenite/antimonite-responsive transcriptional repressor